MADENFRAEIIQYIRENGYVKGEPNLTSLNICSWVKENYEVLSLIGCMIWGFPISSLQRGFILMDTRGKMWSRIERVI